jgi:ATPase subunit of ABC transporter with duplicated ATPase domains
VQFEEMNGWNADSDAAQCYIQSELNEEHHYTLMGDLEGKIKVRVLLQASFGNPDFINHDVFTNDLILKTIAC